MNATPLQLHLPAEASSVPTERGKRIEQSLATGTRIASSDISLDTGWYVRVPHGLLTVLCQAHGLSGTQYRYLLTVYQHSIGMNSPYAITSLRDRRPPTIQQWQQWLDLSSPKQLYTTRRALQQLGVIAYVAGKSEYIALNVQWESWDPNVFSRQTSRRKLAVCSTRKAVQLTLPLTSEDDQPEETALFLSSAPDISRLPQTPKESSLDTSIVICSTPPQTSEARPEAAAFDSPKKVRRDTQEGTDASASGAPGTPIALAHSPLASKQENHEPRPQRLRPHSSRRLGSEPQSTLPSQSTLPPLSHDAVPRRLNGETTRAFWLRCYHQVAGDASAEQRLAHRCAQAELGFAVTDEGTLPASDCHLLGQLRHAAGSWGTVLHWLIDCSSRAVAEPRGYLRGIARRHHEQHHLARGKPRTKNPPVMLPITKASTPSTDDKVGNGVSAASDDGEVHADEAKQYLPLSDATKVRNIVRLVYAWPYPVGRDVHLSSEQSEAFIDAAITILVEQLAPVETCRWRAERAARMAQAWYPQTRGQARADSIIEALHQRW